MGNEEEKTRVGKIYIPGIDLYIMRRRWSIQIGRWKFEIYENRLAAAGPRFD